ncbi:MAG: HD domain-containing protein [Oscillospiraceae bacterium]|nr:HD domain-containing protein [Oscillospiraceae bacterium]
MTYEQITHHPEVLALLERGNANLGVLGFTDHSKAHCALVAERAGYILRKLGYSEHEQELAKIAGFMHDIGNAINRTHHAEIGAILANDLLKGEMTMADRIAVIAAIGNHDESTGGAKDPISAALVLADKTDVRRNRVRTKEPEKFDIHDRVNYAVTGSSLKVEPEEKKIALNLQIDENICTMYEYFDIFLGRMLLCRGAAEMLGCKFRLTVNGGKVL